MWQLPGTGWLCAVFEHWDQVTIKAQLEGVTPQKQLIKPLHLEAALWTYRNGSAHAHMRRTFTWTDCLAAAWLWPFSVSKRDQRRQGPRPSLSVYAEPANYGVGCYFAWLSFHSNLEPGRLQYVFILWIQDGPLLNNAFPFEVNECHLLLTKDLLLRHVSQVHSRCLDEGPGNPMFSMFIKVAGPQKHVYHL